MDFFKIIAWFQQAQTAKKGRPPFFNFSNLELHLVR